MSATNGVTGKANLKVTPISDWNKPVEEGVLIQLPPSGRVVRIRPVGMDLFIRLARIPDTLTPVIAKTMGIGPKGKDDDKVSLDDLRTNTLLFDEFAKICIIEPEVVDSGEITDPTKQIGVDKVDFQDKEWLLGFLNQPARILEDFRLQPIPDVDSVDAKSNDGASAVEDAAPADVVPEELPRL